MMYFISKVSTWSPANRKCKELQGYIDQYNNCLIADECSLDALTEEIGRKVEELNQAYPRTKRVRFTLRNLYASCEGEGSLMGDNYVFAFHIHPVHRTYRYAEKANATLLTEGGEE